MIVCLTNSQSEHEINTHNKEMGNIFYVSIQNEKSFHVFFPSDNYRTTGNISFITEAKKNIFGQLLIVEYCEL